MELKTVAVEAMPKASLEEMLAIIPQHNLSMLDQKVNDANLMKIASALIKWRTVCTDLRITEAEEEAITQENPGVDAQRYVGLKVLMAPRVTCGWSVMEVYPPMDDFSVSVPGSIDTLGYFRIPL